MSAAVLDPEGVKLKRVLLQILESDHNGPRVLCVRHDDETMSLVDPAHRRFLLVWVPENIQLGEISFAEIYDKYLALKVLEVEREAERTDLNRQIASVERDIAAQEAELKTKTEELRKLQRERDPARLEAMVAAAVTAAEDKAHSTIGGLRSQLAEVRRENEELRASKRKLKEANDRLKEKRP